MRKQQGPMRASACIERLAIKAKPSKTWREGGAKAGSTSDDPPRRSGNPSIRRAEPADSGAMTITTSRDRSTPRRGSGG